MSGGYGRGAMPGPQLSTQHLLMAYCGGCLALAPPGTERAAAAMQYLCPACRVEPSATECCGYVTGSLSSERHR
jgi:hypothetical protein